MVFDRFKKMFGKGAEQEKSNTEKPSESVVSHPADTMQDATIKTEQKSMADQTIQTKTDNPVSNTASETIQNIMDAKPDQPDLISNQSSSRIVNEPKPEENKIPQTNLNSLEMETNQIPLTEPKENIPLTIQIKIPIPPNPPLYVLPENNKNKLQEAMLTNNHAIQARRENNIQAALEEYHTAIKLYPQYAIAYYNLAILYQSQQQLEDALENYNKAIELNQRDPEFFNNRANLFFQKNKYESALQDYNMSITLFPNYSESYHNRAQLYAKIGKTEEAIKDCTRAIELNPDLVVDYYNLACLYARQNDSNNAFSYLEKALKKGYRNFTQIRNDIDWQNLQPNSTFGDILDTWDEN